MKVWETIEWKKMAKTVRKICDPIFKKALKERDEKGNKKLEEYESDKNKD